MPYSFFTRLLAGLLVCGFAAGILWPDEGVFLLDLYVLGGVPLLLALLAWNVVRDAPPFDDRAFHRSLPQGDRAVFWKTVRLPLLLLAWVAALVTVYCIIHHFSWRAGSYGIVALILPMAAVMGFSGTLASLLMGRKGEGGWRPWVKPLCCMVASWALFGFLIWRASRAYSWWRSSHPYLTWTSQAPSPDFAWSTLSLLGAVYFPIVWWRVTARRQWRQGILCTAVGVLLAPWILAWGGFNLDRWTVDREPEAATSALHFHRKIPVKPEGVGIPVSEVLTVDGLRKDEFLLTEAPSSFPEVWEGRTDDRGTKELLAPSALSAGVSSSGETKWGDEVIWEALQKRLPGNPVMQDWNERLREPHFPLFLRPGQFFPSDPRRQPTPTHPLPAGQDGDRFFRMEWRMSGHVVTFGPPMIFDVAKGGSRRLPGTGTVSLRPLHEEDSEQALSLTAMTESMPTSNWFPPARCPVLLDRPWLLLVDESGTRGYRMSSTRSNLPVGIPLGTVHRFFIHATPETTPEERELNAMLAHGRLYVFWPQPVAKVSELFRPEPGN